MLILAMITFLALLLTVLAVSVYKGIAGLAVNPKVNMSRITLNFAYIVFCVVGLSEGVPNSVLSINPEILLR